MVALGIKHYCHEYGTSIFGFKYCLLVFETSLCTVKKFVWLFPYGNMAFTITITLSNTIFRVSDAAAALVVGPDLLRDQHLLLVETWVAGTSNNSINSKEKTNKQTNNNVNNNNQSTRAISLAVRDVGQATSTTTLTNQRVAGII